MPARAIEFEIVPLRNDAIPQSLDLLSRCLGEGFVTREQLEGWAGADPSGDRIAFVARDPESHRTFGIVLAERVGTEQIESTFLGGFEAVRRDPSVDRLRERPSGWVRTVAVDPEARRSGIATGLVRRAMDELTGRGAVSLYAFGWIRSTTGYCAVQGVLQSLDFEPIGSLDRFWHADSIRNEYDCPACCRPCVCSALFMVRP